MPQSSGGTVILSYDNYLATKTKDVGIRILFAKKAIPDDRGGNQAEGDAIPTVTQRKTGVRKSGVDANASQAVFRFTKSAGPGISHFQRRIRKQSPELLLQSSGLLRNQRVAAFRTYKVLMRPIFPSCGWIGRDRYGYQAEADCSFPDGALFSAFNLPRD
jgi:hypothetical protein